MKIVRRLPDRIMVITIFQRTTDVKSLSKRPFHYVPLPFRPNSFSPPLSSECLSLFFYSTSPLSLHTVGGGGVDFTEVFLFRCFFGEQTLLPCGSRSVAPRPGRAPPGHSSESVTAEFLKFFEFRPEATTATDIPSFRTKSRAIHHCNRAIF